MDFVPDNTVNKLILLYVLDKMECDLTEDTIIDMCYYQQRWISYFTCKIALSELVKSTYIQEIKNAEGIKYYRITQEGRSCLSYFYNEIPTSIRENISAGICNIHYSLGTGNISNLAFRSAYSNTVYI